MLWDIGCKQQLHKILHPAAFATVFGYGIVIFIESPAGFPSLIESWRKMEQTRDA
jgi:hypothetical protein